MANFAVPIIGERVGDGGQLYSKAKGIYYKLVRRRNWNSRFALTGTVLTALLLAGCGAAPQADTGGKGKNKGKNAGAVPVVTAAARLKDVPIEIQVVGNVEAFSTVSLRAQVTGQLTKVNLMDGQYVHRGDQLFTIDPRSIDGQLAQADANLLRSTAQLTQAQANLARDSAQESYSRGQAERTEELASQGVFSKEQARQTRSAADALKETMNADRAAIESARAQMAADQAAINGIRIQRGYTSVVAPIDGRTGSVTQKTGNIVTANTTELAVIAQVEPIYVSFAVPEARLSEVKKYFDQNGKLPVAAMAQDGSTKPENGQMTFIDNSVDSNTGTIRLKATFENKNHTLWPGQFTNVTLQLTTRRDSVVVPNQAVQTGQDGTFVYVVGKDRSVVFRPVKVGPRIDTDMVIESGLEAGELVVTEGQLRLQPGVTVQSKDEGTGDGNGKGKREGKSPDSPSGKNGSPDGSKNPDGFKNKDGFKGKAPGGV